MDINNLRNCELGLPPVVSLCVHLFTIALLLFFGFYHVLYETFLLGASCLAALLVAIFSLISVINQTRSSALLIGFLLCVFFTLIVSSYFHGERGLIYCFAFSSVLFFLLRFQAAVCLGAITIIICSVAALNTMDPLLVGRFVLAMCISFLFFTVLSYQLVKQTQRLEQDANEDYLTGLMNQRSFYAWLGGHLSRDHAPRSKLTLFYFDIDNFKSVNDSFGHAGGDLVLKQFAKRIIAEVIEINSEFCIDSEMHFCRLSGDEFVLACPNTANVEMAADFATRFHETLASPFSIAGRMTLICSSIGIHHFLVENQTVGEVMQLADAAMYKAKKLGEQQFYISEDQSNNYYREVNAAY